MAHVFDHPAAALMSEVEAERAVAATPEAIALRDNIYRSINDYWDYLDRQGLIYDEKRNLLRASSLHVVYDGMDYEVVLKDGPIDRRYNGGEDPDPFGQALNPTWTPRG